MRYHTELINDYVQKQPFLTGCMPEIEKAIELLINCFSGQGRLMVCGNGGSGADADHIVGELVKGFLKKRPLTDDVKDRLAQYGTSGMDLIAKTQGSLPAINLGCHTALMTAIVNDIGGEYIFSQQVAGFAGKNDVVWCISTSGNSKNVCNAAMMAKAKGAAVIGMTGATGGELKQYCDCCIAVPSDCTPHIQDMHSSVYHVICAAVEEFFWKE